MESGVELGVEVWGGESSLGLGVEVCGGKSVVMGCDVELTPSFVLAGEARNILVPLNYVAVPR
jgi:hypothetical protein